MKHLIRINSKGKAYYTKNVPWRIMMDFEIIEPFKPLYVINGANPKARIKQIMKL